MTGEKDAADLCAENAQKAAPAEIPSIEEIARAICVGNPDDCVLGTAGTHEPMVCHKRRWQEYSGQARAVLALFAPILAEKERDNRQLRLEVAEEKETSRISIYGWRGKANEMEARALAAEAALAAERERCAQMVENAMPMTQDMTSTLICEALERTAAAIREN